MSTTQFLLSDPGRLIGMGIEAVNTTAEIYKQGTTTVYRLPLSHKSSSVYAIPNTTSGFSYVSATSYPAPPRTVAEAMLLAGSRQWKASEGAYCVVPFMGQDNPPVATSYEQPWFLYPNQDFPGSSPLPNNNAFLGPTLVTTGVANTQPAIVKGFRHENTHMAGMIFAGLSDQSTITLNWNVYYESFPTPSSDLVTLARPSCVYDPVALELLSRVLNEVPVGVPADMNWDGEWFANIVNKLSDFAPMIGTALGGPAGGALGAAIGTAGKALGGYLAAPSPNAGVQKVVVQAKKQQPKVTIVREPRPARTVATMSQRELNRLADQQIAARKQQQRQRAAKGRR
jgi:hypothetical protein